MTWEELVDAAAAMGAPVGADAVAAFRVYADELLRWNRRVNLTRIVDPGAIVELHFLDSLAAAPLLRGDSLLDIGAGAGFPGLVLKIRDPELKLLLVEAEKKKVSFLKAVLARLDLRDAVALRARASGRPEGEGIGRHATVVSRAVAVLGDWLDLACPYAAPGGRIVALLGKEAPDDAGLRAEGARRSLTLAAVSRFRLPSGASRVVAAYDAPV